MNSEPLEQNSFNNHLIHQLIDGFIIIEDVNELLTEALEPKLKIEGKE
jgi:hypothetical protein